MNSSVIINRHKTAFASTYINRGVALVRGEGMHLYDAEGKKYLDFISGVGVTILGHHHPVISSAISEQANKLLALHSSFPNDARNNMAETLLSLLPKQLSRVYLSCSGTEAVEAALKFAMYVTKKTGFIHADHSYHGKTLGALAVMGNPSYRAGFSSDVVDYSVPFGDSEALENMLKLHLDRVAGVILEPIQGEAGIIVPGEMYLTKVRELCNQCGVLLVHDEIQSGLGRTGKFLASSHYENASPDIVCLGKGLAGGLPISATVITEEINSKLSLGVHTSTFGGNPFCCHVSDAVLNFLNAENIFDHVAEMGSYFLRQLEELQGRKPSIVSIRGKGLMIGVGIAGNVTKVLKELQDKGLLAFPSGASVLRFLPPFILEKPHIDEAIQILDQTL